MVSLRVLESFGCDSDCIGIECAEGYKLRGAEFRGVRGSFPVKKLLGF
jgi:hypothetical protein